MITELSKKMSEQAIQRTRKSETHKGYDTDGYGYQFVVDRFNEVCGDKWGFSWSVIKEIEGQFKTGQKFYEVSVKVDIWVEHKDSPRSCVGGHISATYGDALKGAITNGFKKTASFWGVGRDAYAGTIDDDNKPYPDSLDNAVPQKSIPKPTPKADKPDTKKPKTPQWWAEHWAEKIQEANIPCDWELINSLPVEKRSFKLKEIFEKATKNKKEDSPF